MQDRNRLKKSSDFHRVYSARRRHDGALLTLYVRPNELARPRVGFAVSTKVGGAVVRNQVKRRLREACRAWVEALPGDGVDLIVVARPEAAKAALGALSEDLVKLLSAVRPAPWSTPLEDAGGAPG